MKKFVLITLFLFEIFSVSAQIVQKWNRTEPPSSEFQIKEGYLDNNGSFYCLAIKWLQIRMTDSCYVRKYDSTGVLLWQVPVNPNSLVADSLFGFDIRLRGNSNGYTLAICYYNQGDLLTCISPNGQVVYRIVVPGDLGIAHHLANDRYAYYSNFDNLTHGLHFYVIDSLGVIVQHDTLDGPSVSGDIMTEDNFGNVFEHYLDTNNVSVVYRYLNHQKADSVFVFTGSAFMGSLVETDSTFRYVSQNSIRKYDSNWNLLSTIPLGDVTNMKFDSHHNMYVLQGGNSDYRITKVDINGNILWIYNLNLPGTVAYTSFKMFVDSNDEVIFCGRKFDVPLNGQNDNDKVFISRLDSAGHLVQHYERYFPNVTYASMGGECFGNNNLYCYILADTEHISCINTRAHPSVSGKVFYDGNSNCQFDSTENIQENILLTLTPGNFNFSSYFDGNFYFIAPDGNYSLNCIAPINYQNSCNSSQAITIVNGICNIQPSFGIVRQSNINDLSVDAVCGNVRSSRPVNLIIHYKNLGPQPVNGTVYCNIDNVFTINNSFPAPDSIFGNSLAWNFYNLNSGQSELIALTVMPSIQNIGTAFVNSFSILATGVIDNHPYDNNFVDSGEYVGSFDPNEKSVNPGFGPSGAILTSDSILNFHIKFQNTGNDTAFYVQVIDTLDPSLDPTTFIAGAIYPPGSWSMQNNVLKFTFDPIYLPDSTIDELNSHGYINYFIKQKPNLATNTIIRNRADIYFDHNAPVRTNTTISTVTNLNYVEEVLRKGDVEIFPNPSLGKFNVHLSNYSVSEKVEVLVRNILGEIIYKCQLNSSKQVIDLGSIEEGVYICSVSGNNISFNRKLLVEKY